ncbi:MAG: PTS sugar transporter subunit IIA [Wenzhouxiangellaceae bacterium]
MTRLVMVCHEGVGEALLDAACVIVGRPLPVRVYPIHYGVDPDGAVDGLKAGLSRLESERESALILTDLPGATPHNIACRTVAESDPGIPVVTGLNLPMLLRALHHLDCPPSELAEMVEDGGRAAIFIARHP